MNKCVSLFCFMTPQCKKVKAENINMKLDNRVENDFVRKRLNLTNCIHIFGFCIFDVPISTLLQNVLPVLKWVRGEPLSQDHWLELFRLLKMPRGTTLEKLTFGQVLKASDQIIANANVLKVC